MSLLGLIDEVMVLLGTPGVQVRGRRSPASGWGQGAGGLRQVGLAGGGRPGVRSGPQRQRRPETGPVPCAAGRAAGQALCRLGREGSWAGVLPSAPHTCPEVRAGPGRGVLSTQGGRRCRGTALAWVPLLLPAPGAGALHSLPKPRTSVSGGQQRL